MFATCCGCFSRAEERRLPVYVVGCGLVFLSFNNFSHFPVISPPSGRLRQDLARALRGRADAERVRPGHEEPRRQPLDQKLRRRGTHRLVSQVRYGTGPAPGVFLLSSRGLQPRDREIRLAQSGRMCSSVRSLCNVLIPLPQRLPGVLFGRWDEKNVREG